MDFLSIFAGVSGALVASAYFSWYLSSRLFLFLIVTAAVFPRSKRNSKRQIFIVIGAFLVGLIPIVGEIIFVSLISYGLATGKVQ